MSYPSFQTSEGRFIFDTPLVSDAPDVPFSIIADLVAARDATNTHRSGMTGPGSLERTMNVVDRLHRHDQNSQERESFAHAKNIPPPFPNLDALPISPAVAGGSTSTPEVQIVHDTPSSRTTVQVRRPKQQIGNGLKMFAPKFHDSHLLTTAGEQRRTSLVVKLGKQVYPDVITPFLKNLCGNGKVSSQFAGRMISGTNSRHVHFEHFRHNMSEPNSPGTNTPYPEELTGGGSYSNENMILTPNNTVVFNLVKDASPVSGIPVNATSFRELGTQMDYWAPFNKPDYEDMSWNLCRLRLGIISSGSLLPEVQFDDQIALFEAAAHRRHSAIFLNNNYISPIQANEPAGTGTQTGQATYKFNAVFNKGKIEYQFMNKGSGAAKVEVIIYRKKKINTWTTDVTAWYPTSASVPPPSPTFKMLENSIGGGYVDKMSALMATDVLDGRVPKQSDISINPNYPLFPKLKETHQGDLAFVEVARQTFGLSSGDRRNLVIDLPGIVYNPVDSQQAPGFTPNQPGLDTPILDPYTYTVCLACSGALTTNQYTGRSNTTQPLPPVVLLGDQYAGCNVQYLATYTEHIGAMQYQKAGVKNIYTRGYLLEPAATVTNWTQENVNMLSSNAAIRVPPTLAGNAAFASQTATSTTATDGAAALQVNNNG